MIKQEDTSFVQLDGYGWEVYQRFSSICTDCIHFKEHNRRCIAFPEGIPDEYLSGDAAHHTMDSRQVGSEVFTPF